MKCRLLYLVGQLGSGGLERQLYYLLRGLDRERYRPAVVVWNGSAREFHAAPIRDLGVPLRFLQAGASSITKLAALRRLVLELRPEVIHSYSFYTNFAAQWAAWGTKAVAIGSLRSDFFRAKKECGPLIGALSGRWPRAQIFNSFSAAQAARRSRSLFKPEDVSVVSNSLEMSRLHCVPMSEGGRSEILGIGSLLPVKCWDRGLRAAQALKKKGFSFYMRIVGEGPLKASLQRQADSLGIADCVEFCGHRADIDKLLGASAFLIHPSDSEGCPNVIMEAMACGRPVVATDAGDAPLLVENGKTGFIVRRGDERELADRMAALLQDQDLRRRMGEAGRRKAEKTFALERLAHTTLAAYRAAGWEGERRDQAAERRVRHYAHSLHR